MALEDAIGRALLERKLTLSVAESCTGGLLGHRITSVAGSSGYFLGGVIAYSDAVKVALLGVAESDLASCGAVSETVAEQMARGVRARLGADVGIAVTGVAGPGGGTPDKPVGLVFVAVADSDGSAVRRCAFSGEREAVREQGSTAALRLLWDRLV